MFLILKQRKDSVQILSKQLTALYSLAEVTVLTDGATACEVLDVVANKRQM